jgi:cation:H+ antiporter
MSNLIAPALSVVGGLAVLVAGGEALVRGASALAAALRISPLVIGLTVVAFGTSAPELAVSVRAAYSGSGDLAVGNLVGSNIANVLLILGLSALVAPLAVASTLVRRDVPLMVGVSVLLLLLGMDGRVGVWDGSLLLGLLVAYLFWSVRQGRTEAEAVKASFEEAIAGPDGGRRSLAAHLGWVVAGLLLLILGARWLVDGSVEIARLLGVPELVIGLTVVAVGTSLPELVTSMLAALRGQRELAVGNVVGSNLFNILGVLGMASLVAPQGIPVSPAALALDIPIMIATAVACLPIFFTGHRIARWEGGLFFAYYLAYLVYLVLDATNHAGSEGFGLIMVVFVVPLTVLTLAVCSLRALRGQASVST